MQQFPEDPDLLQHVRLDQQFLAARAGAVDVDGRIDALFGDAPAQVHFHVAGALELLVDDLVHLRAGLDQGGGDDGQRTAFLDIARGTEEALRPLQRIGIDTAGEDLARGRDHRVVGAREAGDRIEQDDHILLVFDQALGALDDHLGDLHMARCRLVEGGGDDLGAHAALHLGDFLGPLVDEQDDQVHVRMVVHDGLGDVLQHHRLAGFRLRDDQATLATADWRDQIEDAPGDVLGRAIAAFKPERLAREQRGEILEQGLVLRCLGWLAIDVVDLEQGEVTLAFLRRTDAPGNVVARAQVEAARLRRRHIDVVRTGQVGLVRTTQETEAVLQDFQYAFAVDAAACFRMRLQDIEDHVLLARARHAFLHAKRLGQGDQLIGILALEFVQIDQRAGFLTRVVIIVVARQSAMSRVLWPVARRTIAIAPTARALATLVLVLAVLRRAVLLVGIALLIWIATLLAVVVTRLARVAAFQPTAVALAVAIARGLAALGGWCLVARGFHRAHGFAAISIIDRGAALAPRRCWFARRGRGFAGLIRGGRLVLGTWCTRSSRCAFGCFRTSRRRGAFATIGIFGIGHGRTLGAVKGKREGMEGGVAGRGSGCAPCHYYANLAPRRARRPALERGLGIREWGFVKARAAAPRCL